MDFIFLPLDYFEKKNAGRNYTTTQDEAPKAPRSGKEHGRGKREERERVQELRSWQPILWISRMRGYNVVRLPTS